MSKEISIELIGNSNVAQLFFFSNNLDSVVSSYSGESFSLYLAENADHTEYLARGFSDEGDLRIRVTCDENELYYDTVFVNEADKDASPDEVRTEFMENNGEDYDEVLSYNDWDERLSPDHYMPDLSKYKYCIARNVGLDGYNAVAKLELTVADDFKLSDIKILMADFDGRDAQPQKWAYDLIVETYRAGGVECEVLGVAYEGNVKLISDKSYKSDLLNEPHTFLHTTTYSAYEYVGDNWDYLDALYERLLELGETEA
jgi:hypothetical protein